MEDLLLCDVHGRVIYEISVRLILIENGRLISS